jgi:hypothetical protein
MVAMPAFYMSSDGDSEKVGIVSCSQAVSSGRVGSIGNRAQEHGYECPEPDESAVDKKVACRLLDDTLTLDDALWLCPHSPAVG